MRLADLPPHLRVQAERQLAAPAGKPAKPASPPERPETGRERPQAPAECSGRTLTPYSAATRHAPPTRRFGGGMNKTEAAYNAEALGGAGRYEPVTFHLLGGCRYTPDFMTIDDGVPTFHEVKGSYRLESEGRAWTAFTSAAAQYPFFRWVWAARTKGGGWSVKRLIEPGPAFDDPPDGGENAT